MTKIAYILVSVFITFIFFVGENTFAQAPNTLEFIDNNYNFGEISEDDGSVRHIFEFTNRGKKAFIIESVAANCGCIAPEYTREPVMPRGKGHLTVVFDPKNQQGAFFKEIAVKSSGNEVVMLSLSGTVRKGKKKNTTGEFPLEISDNLLLSQFAIYCGYMGQGTKKTVTVQCFNPSDKKVSVGVSLTDKNKFFSVSAPSLLAPRGKGEIAITCDLSGKTLWGVFEGGLEFAVNGVKSGQTVKIQGVGIDNFPVGKNAPAAKARFDIPYYSFGDVAPGQTKKAVITLKNEGTAPLVVRSVTPAPGTACSLKAGDSVQPGKSLKVEIQMTFGRKVGELDARSISLIINDPATPLTELRLSGNIR